MNVWVIDHAALRFQERVRPGLGQREAAVELARLVREFGRVVPWPQWAVPNPEEPGRFCVEISDGIVVVCAPQRPGRWPLAMTVICRCGQPKVRRKEPSKSMKRLGRIERHERSGRRRALEPGYDEAA